MTHSASARWVNGRSGTSAIWLRPVATAATDPASFPGASSANSFGASRHHVRMSMSVAPGQDEDVIEAFFDLADTIITVRRLIREAWTLYRWDTRPARRP